MPADPEENTDVNRMPGSPAPQSADRPPLNPMPQPAPSSGAAPVFSPETPPLNPMPGQAAPPGFPPGYPAPGFPSPGFPPPAPPQPVYAQPPPAPFVPQVAAPAQALAVPQMVAPVAPVAAMQAAPPPPPPPPPPKMSPYFLCGVTRNERRHHTSKNGRRYTYRPPPVQHPLVQGVPRVAYAPSTMVPPSVDLRGLFMPVRNQLDEGACSGFATAALREGLHAAETGVMLPGYLSPAYLYGRTRMFEGTFPQDAGASIADEIGTLLRYGVCPEDFLPYNADPAEAPSSACDVAAVPFRLNNPQQVDWSNPVNMKVLLANKQPIVIGFAVYESFEEPGSDGKLSMFAPGERMLGGHGVLVVGYNSFGWIVRNQWGADWADKGYCYMPFGYEATWTEAWTALPQP